ncbi:MAG: GWxTD domain-containing protein [Acidobacteriia bacterium]|nr:GWxTD domain-containing protein [Terriglobia bacterium]
MNILETLVRTPLARALGWTLFHFLWEGALAALLLAAILGLCRPRAARLRYGVACATLTAMALAFGLTLAWSLAAGHEAAVAISLRDPARAFVSAAAASAPAEPLPQSLRDRLALAAPLWMAGVLLFYARSLSGWMGARRLRRVGVCAAPGGWQARLDDLRARLRVSRPVALLESCLADVPVIIGFFRPVVLLPLGLVTGLRVEQLESILIHELAHIRRHDYLVNFLQGFVEGLLFYHPAVWWVSAIVRAERENCCDDVVVSLAGDARGYAATLAALEGSRWPRREAALAASGGRLAQRIRRLLGGPEGPRTAAAPVFSIGLLLASIGLALAVWQPKPAPAAQAAPASAQAQQAPPVPLPIPQEKKNSLPAMAPAGPYQKWMSEDVAYIITEAERLAFQRLQTGADREQFIEQFWLRRDPTPGTAENEFREEHYRRIAYANEHFAAPGIAGWRTDRGRIYITYGPPDEIEDHPAGGQFQRPAAQGGATTTFPFQQWRYRYLEGIGADVIVEFVDPAMSGEYRMSFDPSEKDALRYLAPGAGAATGKLEGKPRLTVAGKGARIEAVVNAGIVTVSGTLEPGAGPFHIVGLVLTADQPAAAQAQLITYFNDPLTSGRTYTKSIPLAPGSYNMTLVVTDEKQTGANVAHGGLTFVVH